MILSSFPYSLYMHQMDTIKQNRIFSVDVQFIKTLQDIFSVWFDEFVAALEGAFGGTADSFFNLLCF